MESDRELVSSYVREQSENAFRALVSRHLDLVYATALRQVGDPELAKEITQNVFVTLAKKAPRLGGITTIAGWLHRTAILESKAGIRAELRRRRREDAAATLSELDRHGSSPLEALVPLLDEALLHLREGERLALILRFMEDRSLREVGAALGVEEDAARKRVSRALERVSTFFRQRGFAAAGVAAATTLLTTSSQAAPTGLGTAATQAGLTASGSGSLSVLLFKLASLTKVQTSAACLAVLAVPLAWQMHVEARVTRQQADLSKQLSAARGDAASQDQELQQARDALANLRFETARAELQRDQLNAQRDGRIPRATYQWSDASPLVRVPKQLLKQIEISAVSNRRGDLSEQIREALQITDTEAESLQTAINEFVTAVRTLQAAGMRQLAPTPADLNGHTEEETRVFDFPDITESLKPLRDRLFASITAILGSERSEVFRKNLQYWMPIDDEYHGLNSGMSILAFAHRERFHPAQPGITWLSWQMTKPNGEMMGGSYDIDELPNYLRPYLQDWITRAQSQPALK